MQRVQVAYKPEGRTYTYEYNEDELTLFPGDIVEVPVRQDDVTQAMVVAFGSDYDGPCKEVIKVLRQADPVWQRIEQFRELLAVQCSDGTWNYDPYFHGMANGMILAEHTITGREGTPAYLEAPQQWLKDIPAPESVETEPARS